METFDLGRVLQTAEAIKGQRQQSATEQLRQQYLGLQMQGAQQQQDIQGQQAARQQVVQGREDAAYSEEQQLKNTRMLNVAAKSVQADPASIERWAPLLRESGVLAPDVDLTKIEPDQLITLAGQLAEQTGTELQAYLSANPKFMEIDYEHRLGLEKLREQGTQQRELATQQATSQQELQRQGHGYDMAEIGARGAQDRATAEVSSPAKSRAEGQKLRKEFENLQTVQNYRAVEPLVRSAQQAPDDGYGDLDLIYAVGKILDPASVVREGELALVLDAASPLQKILGKTRFNFEKGGRITPKQRTQLMGMLQGRAGAVKEAYDREAQRFSGYAQEAGMDPSAVIGATDGRPPGGASGSWSVTEVK
jgi:hypothetical protein